MPAAVLQTYGSPASGSLGSVPQALLRDSLVALCMTYRPGAVWRRLLRRVELDDGTLHVLIGDVSGPSASVLSK